MTRASCTITIHAPADALWRTISDFGAAGRYLSGIAACTVDGEGVGALRTLTSPDGSTIVERLETRDDVARELTYLLLTDTPFRDCRTTMLVRALDAERAELAWSAVFDPDGIPASEAAQMLESALTENCLALKHFMER